MLNYRLEVPLKLIGAKDKVSMLTKEEAHIVAKFISNELDDKLNDHMIAIYPSINNPLSLEFVIEVIQTKGTARHGIDEEKLRKFVIDSVLDLFDKRITDNEDNDVLDLHRAGFRTEPCLIKFYEIPFTDAAASMIYCYKQDDYLIPDSDPHDVVVKENIYAKAPETYNRRFLPSIKVWLDLVQFSSVLITGDTVGRDGIIGDTKRLEAEALTTGMLDKEIENISKYTGGFRPFNKVYKALFPSRTSIPAQMSKFIPALRKKNQLMSNSYYVIDFFDFVYTMMDEESIVKKLALLNFRGSTIILYIDIPNSFYSANIEIEDNESNYDRKSLHNTDISKNNEFERIKNMYKKYEIMDIDDSLAFSDKIEVITKVTASIKKFNENKKKADDIPKTISDIYGWLMDNIGIANIIIAYSDSAAYENNYCMGNFFERISNINVSVCPISKLNYSNEDTLIKLVKSYVLAGYGVNNIDELANIPDKVDIDAIAKDIVNHFIDPAKPHSEARSTFDIKVAVSLYLDYIGVSDRDGNTAEDRIKEAKKKEKERKALRRKQQATSENEEYDDMEDEDEEDEDYSFSSISRSFDAYASGSAPKNSSESNIADDAEITLDKMIGLKNIKQQVKDFAAYVQLNKIKTDRGIKDVPISKHMVFMGNPGTAKTTVAALLGKLLKSKGLLENGKVKQVSRDDLCGKYVGWTARLTKECIEEAKGGILFIDEAYSLATDSGGYGKEAIDTLVNYMDKPEVRNTTIIIFAGYPKPMRNFLNMNEGMRSRIGFFFEFPNYSTEELIEIAKMQAKLYGISLTDGYIDKLTEAIENERHEKDFGNGRYIRNVLEKSIIKQSRRIMKDPDNVANYDDKYLLTLHAEDFSLEGIRRKENKRLIGFGTLN